MSDDEDEGEDEKDSDDDGVIDNDNAYEDEAVPPGSALCLASNKGV